jgi:hypothetical protein
MITVVNYSEYKSLEFVFTANRAATLPTPPSSRSENHQQLIQSCLVDELELQWSTRFRKRRRVGSDDEATK